VVAERKEEVKTGEGQQLVEADSNDFATPEVVHLSIVSVNRVAVHGAINERSGQ